MKSDGQNRRDRAITKEIHKLFWRANLVNKPTLIITYLTRIPAVAAYNIFIPLVSAYAIQAIVAKQFDKIHDYALWIIGLAVTYSVLWTLGGLAISKNAIIGSEYIQNRIYDNFLHKDYDFYSNSFFGSLGSQVVRLRDAFNSYGELFTLSGPRQLVIVVAGIIVIGYQSVILAVATLITMIVVLSFTIISSKWRLPFRRRVGEAGSVLAAHIGDALSHGATVKSFAAEDYETKRLQAPLKQFSHEQTKSWNSFIPADSAGMLSTAVATAVLLILSANMYKVGTISLTIVILIQLYVIKLIAATVDIAEMIKRYEEAMGAAYEPVKTMLLQPTILDKSTVKKLSKKQTDVNFDSVDYRYHETNGSHDAIANFSLHITSGEKIGLVGYSGSGKTTLSKLIMRFMDARSGSIAIGGVDIRDVTQKDLREHISYVPQEPLLFHRSIAENIMYGRPHANKTQMIAAAKAAYVYEFVKDMPQGYKTIVGERGVKLSGGQRQRVAIARAILKDAPILLLDEATSALDSKSEQYIQKALWKLMDGRTTLVIAHRLSTIQRMDRIVVMDKGRIVQVGTHDELLVNKQGIYSQLWQHQSGGYIGVPKSMSQGSDNITT